MNMRPRFHEWLPLATQQMRLRNLVRIEGININDESTVNEGEALIYYTLHYTKDALAFYTSEMLPCRDTKLRWAEINCLEILKSNAKCVCIKVWVRPTEGKKETWHETANEPISALSKELSSKNCLSPHYLLRPPDKLLFTWGVYFSGLMLLITETDFKCCKNTLIFKINANYFTAPEYLTPESLRDQLSAQHQQFSTNVPKDIAVDETASALGGYFINSPHTTPKRGNSPSSDWLQELLRMSRQRYETLNWPVTDVRKSYNIKKLLRLQQLQRQHKEILQESANLVEEIKQLSVRCITTDQLLCKPRRISYSASPRYTLHSGMGRALSELLAEEQPVDPATLLQAQALAKQVETLRAKQSLLLSEQQTYAKRNQQLQEQLDELKKNRKEHSIWLAAREEELSIAANEVQIQRELVCEQKHKRRCIMQHLEQRMSTLCLELRKIYPIATNTCGFHTICNIAFPNIEAYMTDAKYASSISVEHVSPMGLSATLGYVAHLVQIISIVINQPLRNPIIHEGSRSRILDIIKEIPYSSREFPLFTRSAIPSKAVKYAIYLLNQNIAQLCYDITGVRCDLRGTIENILRIFCTFAEIEEIQLMPGELPELIEETNKTTFNKQHSHAHINVRHSRLTLLSRNRNLQLSNSNTNNNAIENGNIGDTIKLNKSCSSSNTNKNAMGVVNIGLDVADSACGETLSKSHSSVDMNYVPMHVPMMLSSSSTATAKTTTDTIAKQMALHMSGGQTGTITDHDIATQQRICRSVGSYSDCEEEHFKQLRDGFLDLSNLEHAYSSSDSHINFHSEHI